jgi:8-oxo-dGTP diphosphatase
MTVPSNATTDRLLLGVSVCIFRADEVLMIERGKAPGIGLWAPVGGGIEPGETAEAAALREVAEEVAVEIALIGRVGTREIVPAVVTDDGQRRILLEVFAARWLAREPVAGSDARSARFVPLDRIEALPLMPGVEPWIDAARRLFDGVER